MDTRRTRYLLYALFFLSGVAGLIYQIVWTRMLVLVFGNTMLATSTVLSAFMGGLAAGSYFFGRHVDRLSAARRHRLVTLYAALEAGIGGFALLFPLLLDGATPVYAALFRALEGDLVALNLVRFAVCFALISVPTFLMGGTLPILLKHFAPRAGGRGETLGTQTGFLYGLNTAGAVAGTLACGYLLLEALGMAQTTLVAVGLNLGVAAVAWVLGRREATAPAPSAGEPDGAARPASSPAAAPLRPGGPPSRATVAMVLVGIGLSGFCALAYEVLWTRMLNLFLHNNIYSFTAILATFLVGIALGSFVYGRFLSRIPDQVPLFVALEVGIGVLAYATPFVFSLLHEPLFRDLSESLTLAKTAVIMVPPTILMGIAVPMAVQICQRGVHREGTTVGTVYAINTLGSILGAFAAGFVLLPLAGLQMGVIVVASLNVAAGVLPAIAHVRPRLRPAWGAALALAVAAFVLLAPSDLFRALFERSHPSAELLHYEEGRIANVVVYDFEKDGYKDLHLNAVEEASSRLWHVQLFKLLGILPPMLHENPSDALMIAFGAGMSAGAAADHVDELTVVDLNPDIEGVAEIFTRENLDVIHHPAFRKVVNDGRNALLLSPEKYSLIISDATNPKMFDSWTLYSREFYELVASRLEPGGLFAQWVLIPLPADSIKVTLNTFRSVFPHASLWCIYGSSQCLMLATPERLEIDVRELRTRLEPVLEPSGLRDFGIDSVEKLLSFFLLGEDGLDQLLAGFDKINTDDLPHAQFHIEQDAAGIDASLDLVRHRESILRYLTGTGGVPGLGERLALYGELSRRLHLGFITGDATRYREAETIAAAADLVDANVRNALHYGPEKRRYFEQRIARLPDDANAHNTLGYIAWQEGDHARAERSFERAISLEPEFAAAHANLARLLVAAGRLDRATAKLREVRELNPTKRVLETTTRQLEIVHLLRKLRHAPDDPALHRALGIAYYNAGEIRRAIASYRAAARLAPQDPEILFNLARILETHELLDETISAYDELSRLVPGNPRIQAKRSELAAAATGQEARRAWLNARIGAPAAAGAEGPPENAHPETCDQAFAAWHDVPFDRRIGTDSLVRAAALYEDSVAARPDDLHAYVDAATIYEILENRTKAAALWRRAARIRDDWPVAPLQAERLELEERLARDRHTGAERAETLLRIGEIFRTLGYKERAIDHLRQAVEADPDHPEAPSALAGALSDVGLYEEARAAAASGRSHA